MTCFRRSAVLIMSFAFVSLALASPASAYIGPIPCSPESCDAGCCMAGCLSGSTSDESLIASAENAFINDVRSLPYSNDELLQEGYEACSLLSQGADRETLAVAFSRNSGQSVSDGRYFVSRAMVRLCPVL